MKATPRSALFQLNLVACSYPSWCGHHRVDSEIDLSPGQRISRKLDQHGGIILTGHWIEIDHTAPWHDTPDPHGGLADPQLAADPGVLHVPRGVAGVDKEWQPVISGCLGPRSTLFASEWVSAPRARRRRRTGRLLTPQPGRPSAPAAETARPR
jgi:hypothetical protein